jgi:hypothetical protein
MEINVQPHQYYLICKPRGAFAILAATDVEIKELYNEGVRWRGSPFKTRAEAQAALEALKQTTIQQRDFYSRSTSA